MHSNCELVVPPQTAQIVLRVLSTIGVPVSQKDGSYEFATRESSSTLSFNNYEKKQPIPQVVNLQPAAYCLEFTLYQRKFKEKTQNELEPPPLMLPPPLSYLVAIQFGSAFELATGLQTVQAGPNAARPPARFISSTGCPRNAQSRASRKVLPSRCPSREPHRDHTATG
jgi:hypothetical protein